MKKIAIAAVTLLVFGTCAYAADPDIGVVCYHSVSDNPLKLSTFCISDDEFKSDIEYLRDKGYNCIMPKEMWNSDPGVRNIVLTFDDGYEDFYEVVFPILKEYNVKAAVYIIGSEIDKTGYLKSWQIKEIDQSGLVEIGNHTNIMHSYEYTESELESNSTLREEFIEDVKECNSKLYSILGHGAESFSYPGGKYTSKIDSILRVNLGYTTTFTTDYGIVRTKSDITRPMKRLYRIHGDNMGIIEQRIEKFR